MENYPSVAVVITVHNRIELTKKCLKILDNVSYPNFEIIIVDDGSTDGTYKYLKEHRPEVIVVEGDGNQWYGGGMNLGIRKAFELNFEYILFLNNDNLVEPDFLNHLMQTTLDSNNIIVCSLVLFQDSPEDIRFGGGKISNLTGLSSSYNYKKIKKYIKNGTVYKTDYAGGMGILISSSQLKDIGLFDEKHFPMCSDGELWLRATRKKNYKLFIDPKAIVYGSVGQGSIRYKPTIKQLIRSLTDMKCCNYYKYVILSYYRYFPKLFLPYYVSVRYFRWIFGGLALISKSNIKGLISR